MKKITFDKTKLIRFSKKYFFLSIIVVLFLLIIWNLIFIAKQVIDKQINPSQVISQEEQINQAPYDNVIAKDNKKKENKIEINKIDNPF